MARDRKRAKQRRERRAPGSRRHQTGTPTRADVPGALDHASADADEFEAAIVSGADGVPAEPGAPLVDGEVADPASVPDVEDDALHLDEHEVEAEALAEGDIGADQLEEPGDDVARRAPGGGGPGGGVSAEQASGAPIRGSGGNRVLAFFRASWAELQRVQWPDRRQVTQATAVVLGFVAVAGAYLGLADYVAKEIVEFIL
ncbi:MAG TPA: preprotein translocase subunit SecE [Solirubrobacteraceae bacterium]|nr:preprotein translocase subunit SecE [Solirubrobacteraceae bacterium]